MARLEHQRPHRRRRRIAPGLGRPRRGPVAAVRLGATLLGAALLGATLLGGCLEIDGGAVEVGWILRDTRQHKVECDPPSLAARGLRVDRIRLEIRLIAPDGSSGADLCATGAVQGCSFACDNGDGTTPFDIPVPDPDPGDGVAVDSRDYWFRLVPLSQDGTPIGPDLVSVPPPVRRTVRLGDITDLGIWELVVPAAD